MEKTTLKKNKEGYGYKYTELAEIHKYLEENNMRYYQEIETCELNGCDYIMTYRFIDGKWEDKPKRGCKVADATLAKIDNPAQEQGSALTYARRYSLLMAFGLATEDDDAEALSKKKESKSKVILATENQIKTIKSVLNEEQIKKACDLVKKEKLEDFTIQEASNLIQNLKKKNKEESEFAENTKYYEVQE